MWSVALSQAYCSDFVLIRTQGSIVRVGAKYLRTVGSDSKEQVVCEQVACIQWGHTVTNRLHILCQSKYQNQRRPVPGQLGQKSGARSLRKMKAWGHMEPTAVPGVWGSF